MNKLLIFIALSVATLHSCHKPCNQPDYSFSFTDNFFPEKDSISIGDTLWLICKIPKDSMIDSYSQKEVNFSNAENFIGNLIISDIAAFENQRWAIDSFTYFNVTGTIYTDAKANHVKQISFSESDTAFLLKIGLVAARKGIYILTVPDIPGVYRKGYGKCGAGNFEILNANTNQHLYLFEDRWGQLASYDRIRSYCFKVK